MTAYILGALQFSIIKYFAKLKNHLFISQLELKRVLLAEVVRASHRYQGSATQFALCFVSSLPNDTTSSQ